MRSFRVAASIAALLAVGLDCAPAVAQGDEMQIVGTLGTNWSDYLLPGKATHANDWLASGAALLTIDNPGINIQANFENHQVQVPSAGSDDVISYGGDVFWRDYAGSFGIDLNFADAISTGSGSVKGTSSSDENFGLFGQWFALRDLTLQLKGGRFEGHREGLYGDGGVVFYPYADIALGLTLDYAETQHTGDQVKDAELSVEYLPVHDVPVSLYLGYDYSEVSQLSHQQVSVLMIGLKAYLGGGGRSGTLVDYQRNNATNWDGPPPQAVLELGF